MRKIFYLLAFLFVGCSMNTGVDICRIHHRNKLEAFSKDTNTYTTVFMGDSITEGGAFESVISNSKNVGIGGDRIYNTEDVIPYVVKYNPQKIYLLIGINSLFYYSAEESKEQYSHLIEKMVTAFPNTQIIVETVLPTVKRNPKISVFNDYVKQVAQSYDLGVLDLYSLYEVNGCLPYELSYDGTHLTQEGYSTWYNELTR